MNSIQDPREIHEAINAADDALIALRQAEKSLSSAGNWGVLDLLGGGFFSSLMKHGRIDQAQHALEDARFALQRLQTELSDLRHSVNFKLDVGGFLRFADYAFDDLVSDVLIQSKISRGKQQVRQAIRDVERFRAQLWRMLG